MDLPGIRTSRPSEGLNQDTDSTNGPLLPAQPSNSYKHTSLPSEEHVRILILQPGSKNDPICCKITLVTRNEAGNTYDAISYVWGDPKVTKPITCDGATLFITVNLFDALCALRDPAAPRRLWVDAICINQGDEVEKGNQVKRMGNIYQDAKTVIGWVGRDTDGLAADCFNAIRQAREYLDDRFKPYNKIKYMPRLKKPYTVCDNLIWKSKVEVFLDLPWFSRVWVTQEVGLAQQCFITWGEQQLDIAELVELALWAMLRQDVQEAVGVNGIVDTLVELGGTFACIQASYTNKETWRSSLPLLKDTTKWKDNSSSNFMRILAAARRKLASDPRDHIYAFLGHPSARKSNGELIIEPHYDKDIEAVSLDLACACLNDQQQARFVLRSVQFRSNEQFEQRTWPSWVPRWHVGLQEQEIAPSLARWKAGGEADLFQAKVEHGMPFAKLKTKAIIFDSLTWMSNMIVTRDIGDANIKQSINGIWQLGDEPAVDTLRRQAFEAAPCPAEQEASREDAFSFTFVLGYGWHYSGWAEKDVPKHRLDYAAYLEASRSSHASQTSGSAHSMNLPSSTNSRNVEPHLIHEAAEFWHLRRMICTKDGRFGVVPRCTKISDVCCIIPGIIVPFILRPVSTGVYNLIGDAYIHGVMNGELMDEVKNGKRQLENITLV